MKSFTVILLATAAGACGAGTSSTVVAPSVDDYDDTAQAIASSTVHEGSGDFVAMADATDIALGIVPLGFTVDSNGQLRGNRFGITFTYRVSCEDAQGTALPLCGELTDRASVDFGWAGTLASPHLDAGVTREGSWTIAGLRGRVATFDGDGTFHVDATLRPILRPGVTERFTFDADSSYSAVAVDTGSRAIVGGAATYDLTARRIVTGSGDGDLDRTFELHAALAFSGDGTATLVLDGEHTYSIDLSTGIAIRVGR
ncbi:MAG: hypothetical protein KIT31_41820 [Deltaproteobacteria bacterium]|nr:hypothetical protein [Deltaproteobacteria bacterium]